MTLRTRIKFRRCNIVSETMQLLASRVSSNEKILNFRQLIKTVLEETKKKHNWKCKIFNFSALNQMSSTIFFVSLARFNLQSSPVKPVASSNWKFTFANSENSLSNLKLFLEWELSSNWFSAPSSAFKRRPFHQN